MSDRMTRCALSLVPLVALVAAPAARANCSAPMSYGVRTAGSTVQVCPAPYGPHPACPGDGLLRVDAAGQAVLLTTCDAEQCFVDECVAPGRYQYGLKTPFACAPSACGTYYFGTAELTASATGCARTVPAPAPFAGPVPWGGSELVCGHQGPPYGCGTSGAAPVLGLNALVLLAGLLLWRWRRSARRG